MMLFHRHRRHSRKHRRCTRQFNSLADIPAGQTVQVIDFLDRLPPNRKAHLQAYGIVPGYMVKVIQQHPVTVVQVDFTELALEPDLAKNILVEIPVI